MASPGLTPYDALPDDKTDYGIVPPDFAPTNYWAVAQRDGPMTVYDIVFDYQGHAGNIMMPVTGLATADQVGAQGVQYAADGFSPAQPVAAEVMMPVTGLATPDQIGALGVAGSPVAAEIIQVEAPWMIVMATFQARRAKLPVIQPDWRPPSASKYVLHRWRFRGKDKFLDNDSQTYIHCAEGFFEYFVRTPFTPGTGFPMGAAPYQTLPASAMGVLASEFNTAIFPLGP